MTAEDIAVMALGRAIEFSSKVPSARSVMYRRIGIRQQELFIRANKINPDWAGVMAVAPVTLWAGTGVRGLDLRDLIAPNEAADLVTRIEVADKGASVAVVNGQEVNIITLADPDCEDAPRVFIRNKVILAYNDELDLITSLNVYYSRIPAKIEPTDGDCDVEIDEPHVELLVVDLTKHLLGKTMALNASERTAAIASLTEEETPMLAGFDAHVARYSDATKARFSGSRYSPGAS